MSASPRPLSTPRTPGLASPSSPPLTLTLHSAGRSLEMELIKPEGMSQAQALVYHAKVLGALEAIVAATGGSTALHSARSSDGPGGA